MNFNYVNNVFIFASFEEGKEEPDGGSRFRRYGPMAVGRFRVRCRVVSTFDDPIVRTSQIFFTIWCMYLYYGDKVKNRI